MDKERIFNDLIEKYKQKHKKSEALFEKTCRYQIKGGSHNLRLFNPFPFYDVHCSGSQVTDVDGNTYIDFWQGHFANVLGHNPQIVLDALMKYFEQGQGLITGFPGTYQKELAELILNRIHQDKIRFSTSGTLATMYAIMLAKSFTKRDLVMKIGGGWHGGHPYVLKGISSYDNGLNQIESAGLPSGIDSMIIITKFNDIENLQERFKEFGERIACLILEPFVGSGGLIFGNQDYIQKAKELANEYGVLLIMDEVISGFRFHAGGLHMLYDIKPDLTVFGKSIGGGMPVSAVTGRDDVMSLIDPETPAGKMVKFEGGTFSAHPASILAGVTFVKYLIENESEIYPKIGRLGAKVRKEIEEIFATYGFNVKCTGDGNPICENSSIVGVHFLKEEIDGIKSPEEVWNPEISDFELRDKIFKLSMLEEGFNVMDGYGAISAAHSDEEIQASLDAVERIAKKWSK
ncbi:MAG: aminotransferase class III-fold pyridoxal phosphate-dependent enzyme [Desulfobacterales bacterium]